ncbi:Uncharacterised protein [BD1-7 clade bacterium]|uniref:TIGR02281 family clan AA aspartic protease n=1 Tax=BD1-7 clade bacterium TaxID=2029982 RepID=A0A5S9PJS9_9GAMM|nr:Uncharacterised protein [BD1-7 clade bacterium]CAA0104082.1 Uncharacterised protein [BD1-7 clade bacterium]
MSDQLPPDITGSSKKVSSIWLWMPLALGFMVIGWLLHTHYNAEEPLRDGAAPLPIAHESEYERTVTLKSDGQGHYVFSGYINDKQVNFLLDTGATSVAVPESLASYLGLWKRGELIAQTANGNAKAWTTRIDTIRVGNIELMDISGSILPNMQGDQVLLGVSFLRNVRLMQVGNDLQLVQKKEGTLSMPWDQ